jgi:enoyl-CoA hydratase/3-hydroxyacyl-CoA dehydrogenase
MLLPLQPIKDAQAVKLGLVDKVVPPAQLLEAARQLALDIAQGRHPRMISLHRTDK